MATLTPTQIFATGGQERSGPAVPQVLTKPKPGRGTRASNPPPISEYTQESFVRYSVEVTRLLGTTYNLRGRMQDIDRVYQRETDYTETHRRALAANRNGDASKMQNVVLPVVMPQVEALLSELSEIFLSSYPLFPVFSKPKMQDIALQFETVIGEQGVQFGWASELMQCMRDGLKYNLMACEVEWVNKKVYAVNNDASVDIKHGVPTETLFAGNALKRRDPYNIVVDTRVPPFEVHTRGEYAGYTEMIGRMELKQRFAEMDPTKTMNAKEAFESGPGLYSTTSSSNNYYVPQVNPLALVDSTQMGPGGVINWMAWADLEKKDGQVMYSNMYEYTVIYARILPSEHRIYGPNGGTPQIWKMIIVNRKVCIFAERQTNAHNYLPIIVAQCHEDGLGWQSKSFADNATPFQALASALYNSGIESQRRKVYDRIFYDPSRINKGDIDNTSVIARVPIKNEAFGKPVSEAYSVVPYRDDNVAQIFSTADQVLSMADIANGQNRVQRGQFQKGNKTRHEFQDVMDKSDARPRMTARVLEDRFFTPIKTILKLNTMQFQPPTELYNRNTKTSVKIDPVELRKAALEFRMADGLMPTDAYMNMGLFQSLLQTVAQFPPLLQQWDIVSMIFYWLKLEGATWVDDFRIQQQAPVDPATTTANANAAATAAEAQQPPPQ
jgi:hypothetical protein